jgi:2-polyprenyl-3-methyl-5-hydroxy-6-metoxy-1,4-benzoquinol methylase
MPQTEQITAGDRGDVRAGARCPICDQPLCATHLRGRDRLITGDGPFTVMECAACQYGVTLPQLSEEALARYYPSEYFDFWGYSGRPGDNPLHRLLERFRNWSATRSYQRPPYLLDGVTPGRMLDVGCGSGDLLEHFARQGWEIYGIDPSASAIAAAAKRGARVHQGTLRDQPWEPGSFALITFQHALEHIDDPIDALKCARALLEPGGLLVIDVPNWSCWQRRLLFRSRWHPLELPRHLQHFSPRALQRLAALLGLRVRSVGTTSSVPVAAYSLHYVLFGHLTPGWKLWLSYALGILMFPLFLLGDRAGGGDCCFVVMESSPEQVAPDSEQVAED